MVRTVIEDAFCPACQSKGLQYHAEEVDLPFLGASLETMLRCLQCGYRHTDFLLTDQKDPLRYVYSITQESDMSVRVVRSGSGTIRLPELGIEIEPGIASEAFISNIEGVLVRIERVLSQLRHDAQAAGDKQSLARIDELDETFDRMRRGKAEPVTLIIDDPLGNSGILHENALKQEIPPEVAATLKVGAFVIDPGDQLRQDEDEPAG